MDDIPALIKRLEAGLEGVTLGPWYSKGTAVFFDTRQLSCCGKGTFECCGNPDIDGDYGPVADTSETAARHIANCDPDTIRTLLSALQAQAAEIIETRSELIETRAALEKAVMEVGKWAGKFGRQETLTAAAEAKLREAVELLKDAHDPYCTRCDGDNSSCICGLKDWTEKRRAFLASIDAERATMEKTDEPQ